MNRAIDRRVWIAVCIAGMVVLNRDNGAAEDTIVDLDIIDCHTHFYDPTRPEGIPWPGKGTSLYRTVLPKHLRAVKHFRCVTGTIIVEASPRVEDNAWLLDLAKDDPFVVGVVGNLTPGTVEFAGHLKCRSRLRRGPVSRVSGDRRECCGVSCLGRGTGLACRFGGRGQWWRDRDHGRWALTHRSS